MLISKKFVFDSSHQLPDLDVYGKCSYLHGHTYHLTITLSGEPNELGWIIDFKTLKNIVQEKIISVLDHNHLNNIIKLPTAENISLWIRDELLKTEIAPLLKRIKLYETPTSFVEVEL